MTKILIILLFYTSTTFAQTDSFTIESWVTRSLEQSNLLPMYGEQTFTESQTKANEKFLSSLKIGKLRADARRSSNSFAEVGWDYLYKGHLDTAMFRFNQSWLIDSTNIAPYIGFGTIYTILGKTLVANMMYNRYSKIVPTSDKDFLTIINTNHKYYRDLEKYSFKIKLEYEPLEYYSTGQLYLERKKLEDGLYNWRWYHSNGSFLRILNGGDHKHDWIGEVKGFHDNGKISSKGQWDDNVNNESIWTHYDRDGNVARVEYWKKSSNKSSYTKIKVVIFKQEIPWNKDKFVTISEEGWVESNSNYPDGYIMLVYNPEDLTHNYYAIWKDGKRGKELIKVIPENSTKMTINGYFEWFEGKLYKID